MTDKSQKRGSNRSFLAALAADRSGATSIEYAMIAIGISIAIAATVFAFGSTLSGLYASFAALF